MVRNEPQNAADSGWRFFSGFESDEYLADRDKSDIYDVNTVANYDPDIIPFLDWPVGSEFERDEIIGEFIPLVDPEENELFPPEAAAEGLTPCYPAVTGDQALPDGWSITFPFHVNRRWEEDERQVFWRPGLTIFLGVVRTENGTPRDKLIRMEKLMPANAFAIEELWEERLARLGFRVESLYGKVGEERPVHLFYGSVFSQSGYADLTIYFDYEADIATAREIWLSVNQAEPA